MKPCFPAAAIAAAVATIAPAAGTLDLPLPGPAPRAKLSPIEGIGVPTDAGCAKCHEEIAAEWRDSLHHRSWQNAYFVRSYAMEPVAFCRKCHAPAADPAAEPPPEAREAGVGCTTCHVVPAGILGVRGVARRLGHLDGHEVIGDPRLATPAACANCHDFSFPPPPAAPGQKTGPMQDTHEEHKRSHYAGTPCQGCHMPVVASRGGGTHKGHGFRVQGDRAMMAKAVVVKAAVLGEGEVRLEIEPGAIGHAFPTGDLYRRVDVRVTPIDDKGQAVGAESHEVLGRSFGVARHGHPMFARVQTSDTRLTGPRTLTLPVPPATRRARYRIVWQKLPPPLAARLGMTMSEHEMVVTEGVVRR